MSILVGKMPASAFEQGEFNMPDDRQSWRCMVCGYVHHGDAPPDSCPICGALKEDFEAYSAAAPVAAETASWRCTVCGYIHEGDGPPDLWRNTAQVIAHHALLVEVAQAAGVWGAVTDVQTHNLRSTT